MKDHLLQFLITKAPGERAVAINAQGNLLTLDHLRGEIAGWMTRIAVHPVRRWALSFDDSYQFTAALFAVLLSGSQAVLPDPLASGGLAAPADQYDGLLGDQPSDAPGEAIIVGPGDPRSASPKDAIPIRPESMGVRDDHAYSLVFFTSGSTGTPKPIVKSLAQISREAEVLRSAFGSDLQGCSVLSTVSHQHFYGFIFRLFFPLVCGIPFCVGSLQTPEQVTAESRADRILISSPAILKRLEGIHPGQGFRLIFSAGGLLPIESVEFCETLLGCRPVDIMGSSETGAIAYRISSDSTTPWQSLPGVEIVADPQGNLTVRADYLTEEVCDPRGWQTSEDRIAMESDGRFQFLGRADRIVKIEEKRISLVQVEQSLERLDEVREVAVVVLKNRNRHELGAVVVLTGQGAKRLGEMNPRDFTLRLRQRLRQYLESVAIPRRFRMVDAIPVNPQGKRMPVVLERLFS